jgi:hypothetical protein
MGGSTVTQFPPRTRAMKAKAFVFGGLGIVVVVAIRSSHAWWVWAAALFGAWLVLTGFYMAWKDAGWPKQR